MGAAKRHSRISISSATSKDIPECAPHLMPFHIAHTGPAPVSTYFRIEEAKTHVGSPEPSLDTRLETVNAIATDNENVASSSDTAKMLERKENPEPSLDNGLEMINIVAADDSDKKLDDVASSSATVTNVERNIDSPSALSQPSSSILKDQARFISTFRGRTVQGLKVDLPEGYTGVVFRSEGEEGEGKKNKKVSGTVGGSAKGKRKEVERRSTRRSAQSRTVEDEAMDVDEEEEDKGSIATMDLVPSSQFKSFVLWHPDIPVDTGNDEYISSIDEWMRIASVLHQTPS